jgi:hypothetical protein
MSGAQLAKVAPMAAVAKAATTGSASLRAIAATWSPRRTPSRCNDDASRATAMRSAPRVNRSRLPPAWQAVRTGWSRLPASRHSA